MERKATFENYVLQSKKSLPLEGKVGLVKQGSQKVPLFGKRRSNGADEIFTGQVETNKQSL